MNIDPKKLLEQDLQFEKFVKDASYSILSSNKDFALLLVTLYSFYQMGMTQEQIKQFCRANSLFMD